MNVKKFIKKLYKASSYSGTTISDHHGKPLTCFFCNLSIGFIQGYTDSILHGDTYYANGIPVFHGWKGHCYRCAIDHDLHNVETIWNFNKININGFRLTLTINNKFYLIDYDIDKNITSIYQKRENTGYHFIMHLPGLIITPGNVVNRLPTVLTFS